MQEKPAKAGERKLVSMVTIVAIFLIAAILAYPKIFKKDTMEKLRSSGERISVAVMFYIYNLYSEGYDLDYVGHTNEPAR